MEFVKEYSGVITSVAITIILCVLSIVGSRNMKRIPTGLQNFLEWAIESLYGFFEGVMGTYACKRYFPLVATLFIYILVCNYSGLLPASGHIPGLEAPTSSINCTAAMAIVVFIMIQVAGVRSHGGIRFYKHLFQPFAFLFPILLLEEFVKPISLTLRLYGNVYGEHMVSASFFEMVPIGVPIVMAALSVLMGLVQALVFSLLAGIYIHEAMPEEGEEFLH